MAAASETARLKAENEALRLCVLEMEQIISPRATWASNEKGIKAGRHSGNTINADASEELAGLAAGTPAPLGLNGGASWSGKEDQDTMRERARQSFEQRLRYFQSGAGGGGCVCCGLQGSDT